MDIHLNFYFYIIVLTCSYEIVFKKGRDAIKTIKCSSSYVFEESHNSLSADTPPAETITHSGVLESI